METETRCDTLVVRSFVQDHNVELHCVIKDLPQKKHVTFTRKFSFRDEPHQCGSTNTVNRESFSAPVIFPREIILIISVKV